MADIADVIVIGAGVQGSALAFHLASRGAKVTVVEKSVVAAGATGRSSGLVRVHYELLAEAKLAWFAQDWFRHWDERVGGECGFTVTGFVWIEPSRNRERLAANCAAHAALGVDSSIIDADEIRRIAPMLQVGDEVGAYEPNSGYADPTMTASSLINAAKARGARLVQGAEVTAIRQAGGRVTGIATTKGDVDAPVIVNAAGCWAKRVGDLAGMDLPLRVWRHDTGYLGIPAAVQAQGRLPVVIDNANGSYFRPEGSDMVLIGLEDDDQIGGSPDRDTADAAPTFELRAAERIIARVPGMVDGEFRTSHSGQDGLSPDQRAYLGPVGSAGPEGFFLDCGHSGTGFKTAPAIGLGMAEWILDGASHTVDLAPFTYQRYLDGKPLVGEHGEEILWR